MKRMRIVVYGRVQNTFFRHTAERMARSLGLTGWIRNVGTDRNESEVQGEDILVDQYVLFVLRGTRLAEVHRMEVEHIPPIEGDSFFTVKETVER